ncbi:MAG: AraC family transcriptional regulator N-terminal domain-containing protein [Chloroflexota bacterium]
MAGRDEQPTCRARTRWILGGHTLPELLGGDTYEYDEHHPLLTSVDLPALPQVIEASKEKSHPALSLRLDQRAIAEMMVDCNLPPPRGADSDEPDVDLVGNGLQLNRLSKHVTRK